MDEIVDLERAFDAACKVVKKFSEGGGDIHAASLAAVKMELLIGRFRREYEKTGAVLQQMEKQIGELKAAILSKMV